VKELLLALPRLGRMLISLAGDRDVPTAAKVVLAAMAVYLVSPIDLIPDFIPWLGYLDDVILAAVVVDGVLNYVDRPLVLRYWPGSAGTRWTDLVIFVILIAFMIFRPQGLFGRADIKKV